MSRWRSEAAAQLPELWRDEGARETANLFFFELLPFVREAHRTADDDALERAYGFAHWCFRQGGDLQNAAAVAFFEHLFDAWDIHRDVLKWIDRRVLRDCWALLELRLDADKLAILRRHLDV